MEGVGMAMTAGGIGTFDNTSVWRNITIWTAQHLGKAVNMSKLAPSLEDLVWAGPRMVMKIGAFISFPDSVEGFGQRVIAEATEAAIFATATTGHAASFTQAAPVAVETLVAEQDPHAFVSRFSLEGAKGLGSVFGYVTSKWALSCIAMAVVFNRTNIFAATRRRLRLRWHIRFVLRIAPIIILLAQARTILQSIQCQTSPDFAELRWGNSSKSSDLMFSQDNPFLHGLSSALLFGATDEKSCQGVKMVPRGSQEQSELRGSLSRLWPVFGTFCLSQFIEVLLCTVQGRPTAAETGMSLFEHSLAFAEADAAVSNQLGWGLFANGTAASSSRSGIGSTIAVTRSMILRRVNTSPEVLLVAFFSSMSHVTSHVLGLFGVQARYRLVSTGFWALCFMGSIVWSITTFSLEDTSTQGLLRFPTVCIIGFIPHVLVLTGIMICGFIYFMALILSAMASPPRAANGRPLSLLDRLYRAHRNMQANVTLSDIRIRMDMDFYTALLRAGFGAITMASEAVYLNEDRRVVIGRSTWLENARMREIEELKMQWVGSGMPGSRFDTVGTIGLVPVQDGQWNAASGYAREKAAQNIPKSSGTMRRLRDGVGAAERRSRWLMALEYLAYVNKLLFTAWAVVALRLLAAAGVRDPPGRLRWLALQTKGTSPDGQQPLQAQGEPAEDWLSVAGRTVGFVIPHIDEIDVEDEVRRHITNVVDRRESVDEGAVDTTLYDWFTRGGWWGSRDTSGDYVPRQYQDADGDQPDSDFDATSVVSASDAATDYDQDSLDHGQRTPTQRWPGSDARTSRASTPLVDMPMATSDLARLLHPSSPEERDEAEALAAHLSSDRIMTRAGYQAHQHRRRAEVLLSSRQHFGIGAPPMSPDEEVVRLEQILLSRRRAGGGGGTSSSSRSDSASGGSASWATGAPGLGSSGPECVVCQSAPRTIIVWPCRCLSLCDDCRVSLAMNNFDKCVCCRREVISFSRIYVP